MSRSRRPPHLQQELVDPDHVVHVTGEGRAEHGGDADRVLVEVGLHVVRADRVLALLQRDDPRLDVEVAAELLPDHVDVTAEHQVRPGRGEPGCLPALLPLPLQRQRAEHDRLRRPLGAAAGRLARGVEQVRQHPHAALLDLGRDRVLGVVDEVAVQVLGDDALRLRLHPGRHEGRQVALRIAFEVQVLGDQPHRIGRVHPGRRGTRATGRARSGTGSRTGLRQVSRLVVMGSALLEVVPGCRRPGRARRARSRPRRRRSPS